MEDFFKSIKKKLETLPGFNFLNFEENEEEKTETTVNNDILDETKYNKLLKNVNENNNENKNKNTRKRKSSKSKTKSILKNKKK